MKRIALSLLVMAFAGTAYADEPEAPAVEPRCDLSKLVAPIRVIPQGAARGVDTICQKSFWDYFDGPSCGHAAQGEDCDKKRLIDFATLTDANQAVAEQKKVLQKYVDLFKAVDEKEKAVAEASKAVVAARDQVEAAQKGEISHAKGLAALKSLLAKEGYPLAMEAWVGTPETKKAAYGGPLYFELAGGMFALAHVELVKRHSPSESTLQPKEDTLDYPAIPGMDLPEPPVAFNTGHLAHLWVEPGDLTIAQGTTAEAVCAELKLKQRGGFYHPAFCVVDRAQGKRIRDLYYRARGIINEVNEYVLTKGRAWEHVEGDEHARLHAEEGTLEGMEAQIKELAEAQAKEARPLFNAAVIAGFKEKVAELTPEELFDGESLAKFRALQPAEREQILAKARGGEVEMGTDMDGNSYLMVDGMKIDQDIVVPENLSEESAESLGAAEGAKVAEAYKRSKLAGVLAAMKYAINPGLTPDGPPGEKDPPIGGGGPGPGSTDGAGSDLKDKAGCKTPADLFRSDIERIKARQLDAILEKKKLSQENREKVDEFVENCLEDAQDKLDETIAKIDKREKHSALSQNVFDQVKAKDKEAAVQVFEDEKYQCVVKGEQLADKLKIQDTEEEKEGYSKEMAKADSALASWYLAKVEKGYAGLKTEYISGNDAYPGRAAAVAAETGWTVAELRGKLPGQDKSVIADFFDSVMRSETYAACRGKLGWEATGTEALKEDAYDATPSNIDDMCGVRQGLVAKVKSLTGTLGGTSPGGGDTITVPTPDELAARCEALRKRGMKLPGFCTK